MKKVTKNINKKKHFVCDCMAHVLQVVSDIDIFEDSQRIRQSWNISMFKLESIGKMDVWNRIKIACRYLRTGKMHEDQIILSEGEAKKLAKFINDNNYGKGVLKEKKKTKEMIPKEMISKETMEVFALKGYKVKVTDETKNNGDSYDKEKVNNFLTINKVYTVEATKVQNWKTDVFLKEVPRISFNSVNFEGVTEQPKELNQQHQDYNRYA